jgi:hypothetical protein
MSRPDTVANVVPGVMSLLIVNNALIVTTGPHCLTKAFPLALLDQVNEPVCMTG